MEAAQRAAPRLRDHRTTELPLLEARLLPGRSTLECLSLSVLRAVQSIFHCPSFIFHLSFQEMRLE